MSSATVRRFVDADADRVVELSVEAWSPVFESFRTILGDELYLRVHPDWRRDQAASVRKALDDHETWVAEGRDGVAGFVNVVFNADNSAEIYMVDPAAQRQGIASSLTDHALDQMRARGVDLAIVATGGDPGHAPARATYDKAGFTPCPQVWYARLLR
jgi:GNAT superfamily N-acetyltransferase